jgi:hypothetical protein
LRHADAQADVHAGLRLAEHYSQRELLGPWSDIYSVGASMYACISASTPQPADDRLEKDRLVPAMVRWEGQYSDQLLETIDWCLCLNHRYRPQSVFALQKALTEAVVPPPPQQERNLAAPGGRQIQEIQGRMKFTIYQESRTGKRANNEDRLAYCYSREALLMVVADGMGGHYYGEVAAQIAVQTLTEAFPRMRQADAQSRPLHVSAEGHAQRAPRHPRLCRQASAPGLAAHHLRRLHRAEQRRLLGALR